MLQDTADGPQSHLGQTRILVACEQRNALFPDARCGCAFPSALSSNRGLGMKVTVLQCRFATFLRTYLNHMSWSPICTRGVNFMSISAWPAVATSWCCASMTIPKLSRTATISVLMSCCESVGETGNSLLCGEPCNPSWALLPARVPPAFHGIHMMEPWLEP